MTDEKLKETLYEIERMIFEEIEKSSYEKLVELKKKITKGLEWTNDKLKEDLDHAIRSFCEVMVKQYEKYLKKVNEKLLGMN